MTSHSLLALLRGERTLASVAAELGETEAEVVARRERLLSSLHRRSWLQAALGVCLVSVASLGAGLAWAQACMAPTPWDSQLVAFCPDAPAVATEVNGNFSRILSILQQKTGAAASAGIQTPSLTVTGTTTSNAYATRLVTVNPSSNVTWPATVNFGNTDLTTSFLVTSATNVDISYVISGTNSMDAFLVTRVLVDGVEVRAGRAVNGNHRYMNNSARFVMQMGTGFHTVAVQYRANGDINVDPSSDFMQRSLVVHVMGN